MVADADVVGVAVAVRDAGAVVVAVADAVGVAVAVVVVVVVGVAVSATVDADDVCTMLVELLTALARPPVPPPADDECDAPSIFGHPLTGLPGAA